jgi:histidinol-phosphate aminotransferase
MGARLAAVAVNRYPDPSGSGLKLALRRALELPDSQEIVLGNGSDEILQIIALALARPGAASLSVEPSFAMYRISAIAAGLRPVGVPAARGFLARRAGADARACQRAARGHLDLVSEQPHREPLSARCRAAHPRRGAGLVVVDEAYHAFAGGATLLPSSAGATTWSSSGPSPSSASRACAWDSRSGPAPGSSTSRSCACPTT